MSAENPKFHKFCGGQIAAGATVEHGTNLHPIPSFEEILNRHPDYFEQALTSKETAALIDSTPAALAQMRSRSTGPKYIRLPTITSVDCRDRPRGPIRYIRRDIIEWLRRQNRYANTAEEVA